MCERSHRAAQAAGGQARRLQRQDHGLRPERSGVGFLFCNEDIKNFPAAWDLFKAMGKTGAKFYTSAGAMMERVASGEHTIAYGIFGSYGLARQRKDPNLGVVLPSDYTMVTSRVAFISKHAKNRTPPSCS